MAGRARRWVGPFLPVIVLGILVLVFALRESRFVSLTNLEVMLTQGGPLLTISLGATLVVLMGSIDLSVGAIAAVAAAASAVLIQEHGFGTVGLILAIAVGLAAGALNAFCVTVLKLPSFIVTLGTLSAFTGAPLHLLSGASLFAPELARSPAPSHMVPSREPSASVEASLGASLTAVSLAPVSFASLSFTPASFDDAPS